MTSSLCLCHPTIGECNLKLFEGLRTLLNSGRVDQGKFPLLFHCHLQMSCLSWYNIVMFDLKRNTLKYYQPKDQRLFLMIFTKATTKGSNCKAEMFEIWDVWRNSLENRWRVECVLAQWAEEIGYLAEPTTAQRPTITSSEPGDLCSSRARRSSANGAAQWNHRQTKVFSAPPPATAKCFTFWPTFTSQQTLSNGEPNIERGQIHQRGGHSWGSRQTLPTYRSKAEC